ncbi:MAG: hypothetical protein IJ736_09510, partial [Firmicutes bacterium]|nr:hypothetical protein [Bacillota bacterium]
MVENIDVEKRSRDMMIEAIKNMNDQMTSIANVYFSLHDIDFQNNKFTEIKTNMQSGNKMLGGQMDHAHESLLKAMDDMVHDDSKDDIKKFVDFNTLSERLKEKDTITEEFLSNRDVWCRARFVVSKRTKDGELSHVLYLVESIDEDKRKRDILSEAAQKLGSQMLSISNIYMTMYEFDINTDTFSEIKAQSKMVTDIIGNNRNNAQETLTKVMRSVTDETSVDEVVRFTDLSTLDERLKDTDTISIEYMNRKKQWRRGRFLVSKRDENREIQNILWLVENIDEEKRERDELIDRSERAIAASEAK